MLSSVDWVRLFLGSITIRLEGIGHGAFWECVGCYGFIWDTGYELEKAVRWPGLLGFTLFSSVHDSALTRNPRFTDLPCYAFHCRSQTPLVPELTNWVEVQSITVGESIAKIVFRILGQYNS